MKSVSRLSTPRKSWPFKRIIPRNVWIKVVRVLPKPHIWAKIKPSVQENLGSVGNHQSSQFTLGGGTHSMTKEVPLIAHSRPSKMTASSPLLEDTLTRIRNLQYNTPSTTHLLGQPMGFESHTTSTPDTALMSAASSIQYTFYGGRSVASHAFISPPPPPGVEIQRLRHPPYSMPRCSILLEEVSLRLFFPGILR